MKVKILFEGDKLLKYHKLYIEFIKFIQREFPLDDDLTIRFLKKRVGKMSTGSRSDLNELKILVGGRINRDILRTLAHEWIHQYQMTILGRERGTDIGGRNEDEANAFSARLIKLFEKKFPTDEKYMYESKKGIS